MSSLSLHDALIPEWTLASVAIVLTAGRYTMRWYVLRKFYWDDLLHGLALCLAIASYGLFIEDTVLADRGVKTGLLVEQLTYAGTALWLTSLWCIKFAFLLLYRMLFQGSSSAFSKCWWSVAAFTFVSYWVALGGYLSYCNGYPIPSVYGNTSRCTLPRQLVLLDAWLIYSYCLNVASDLAIMILPLPWIFRLQISLHRRLGVASIAFLGLVIIAFDTTRFVTSYTRTHGNLGQVWSDVENNIAIIVSCLPSFAGLRIARNHRSQPTQGQTSVAKLADTEANRARKEGSESN